jgi:O-6-methylguanine DNA methyltransferase
MIIHTPLGEVSIGYIGGELLCNFGSFKVEEDPPAKLIEQLHEYFDGTFVGTFDVPLPSSTTFTSRCWEACRNIPYGSTITYAELASNANSPKAFRAAGQAMRRNPMPIITPCHRVVASTGELHGFAGKSDPNSQELYRKRFLLQLENRTIRE